MKNDYIDLCFWVENFQLFCLDKQTFKFKEDFPSEVLKTHVVQA